MMQTAIGVDIGGTRLSVGLVSAEGRLLRLLREPTPGDGETALTLALWMAEQVWEGAEKPLGIGIGFGGPVDFARQEIVRSHHVAGWQPGLKLAEVFQQRLQIAAILDNDANCGGLAEAVFGAGKEARSLLYVNVGTGIGGAVIVGRAVHHGAHSTAGEIGHMVVQPGGLRCTCGKRGCLEMLSSGSAIGRAGEAAGLGAISGKEVGQRALAGDPVAVQVVEEAGRWLGLALGNASNLIDPEIIVVGGGVSELGEVLLEPVRRAFADTVMPAAAGTRIVKAEFGYDAGVIGAAALVM